MKKINVLEIEYKEVFNGDYAVKIKYQNEDVLKRGEFVDNEIGVESDNVPEFYRYTLFVRGKNKDKDNRYHIVSSKKLEEIKSKVKKINEKYGIRKRWRAERGRGYYYIDDECTAFGTYDYRCNEDNIRYELGNYFRTEEDAEKALEKIKQIFNELK